MSLIFQRNSRLVEGNFQQANTPSPTTVLHNLWLPSFVIYGQTFGFPDSGLRLGCCKLKRIFHHTRLNLLLFLIYVYPRRWNRMRWRAFRKICGETWVAALSSGERREKNAHRSPSGCWFCGRRISGAKVNFSGLKTSLAKKFNIWWKSRRYR